MVTFDEYQKATRDKARRKICTIYMGRSLLDEAVQTGCLKQSTDGRIFGLSDFAALGLRASIDACRNRNATIEAAARERQKRIGRM